MPIEVKELIFRTVVTDAAPPADSETQPPIDREELIEDCARHVLKIIERKEDI